LDWASRSPSPAPSQRGECTHLPDKLRELIQDLRLGLAPDLPRTRLVGGMKLAFLELPAEERRLYSEQAAVGSNIAPVVLGSGSGMSDFCPPKNLI